MGALAAAKRKAHVIADVVAHAQTDFAAKPMADAPALARSDAAAEMARHFPACVAFLDSCRARNGRALVHCRAGVSRSATMVIGYLMQLKRWDLRTALRYVDTRRFVQPNSGFIDFLIGLERELFGTCSLSASDLGYAPD